MASEAYIHYSGFVPAHLTTFTFDKEVLALEALYDQAGGDDWILNSNWKTTSSIDTWSNVTVVNRRVTDLELGSNNLVGVIPDEIAELPLLANIDVSDNELIAVTNLPSILTLDIRNNKLNFDNLIPNLHAQYDPQKAVGEPTYDSAYVDENFQLSVVNFTHPQTVFQWGKDTPINGATQADYQIAPLTYETQGAYQLTTTNANVPGLTLIGEAKNVTALDDLAVTITDVSGSGEIALMKLVEGIGGLDTAYFKTFNSGSIDLLRGALSDYLVGVRPDDTNLIPSYYINSFLWDEADELEMRERNRRITIGTTATPPPLTPQDGNGQLIGYVEQEYDDRNGRIEARRRAKKPDVT